MRVPGRAGLSRHAALLRREHHADRVCRMYLALQNGTVEAQENPLTTIEAKKFYEVQKHIVLTGHIVDHLNTIVAKGTWAKFTPDEQKIFREVSQEAAARATAKVKADEQKLVQFFQGQGVDRDRDRSRRVPCCRAEGRDLRAVQLPQGRLGQDPGCEVTAISA